MGNLRINQPRDPGKRGIYNKEKGTKMGTEQIKKIDQEIRRWFKAKQRLEKAEGGVEYAAHSLNNIAIELAKLVLPEDAKVGQIYIFQTTNERFVRVFLRERTSIGPAGPYKLCEAHVEVHNMKKR